jgi:hypothetical protein
MDSAGFGFWRHQALVSPGGTWTRKVSAASTDVGA